MLLLFLTFALVQWSWQCQSLWSIGVTTWCSFQLAVLVSVFFSLRVCPCIIESSINMDPNWNWYLTLESEKLIHWCTTSIDRELYGNNITGTIPPELGTLANLVSLDLYLNGLRGTIPATLSKLEKLRFLYEPASFIYIFCFFLTNCRHSLVGGFIYRCSDWLCMLWMHPLHIVWLFH